MQVQAYLFFDGRTAEALEFYKTAIGAKVEMMMPYKDNPDPKYNPPGSDDKVMHSAFRVGETLVMASDGNCGGSAKFQGFSLVLNARDEAEAKRLFAALSEGGQVQMPLAKTFFSPCFGMVADKFGVGWMVMAAGEGQG